VAASLLLLSLVTFGFAGTLTAIYRRTRRGVRGDILRNLFPKSSLNSYLEKRRGIQMPQQNPKSWSNVLTDAMMHRVTPPSEGATTITVTRSVFDELVKIAQHAVRADSLLTPSQIEAERLPTGWKIVVSNGTIKNISVEAPHLVEALGMAASRQSGQINRLFS
jgi:hypothetical protein